MNVTLTDGNGNKTEWKNLSCPGDTFRFNKTAAISGKGTYTLSVTGIVHRTTNEYVSDKITKTYS